VNTRDDLRVARYLSGLPAAAPPAALGARVLQQCARRSRIRRWLPPLAVAATMAMLLLVPGWLQPVPQHGPMPTPAAMMAEAPATALDPGTLADLRAIDRRLQNAYLAASRDPAIELLWQARSETTMRMQQGRPAPRLVQL
jgi:hypothetical protein